MRQNSSLFHKAASAFLLLVLALSALTTSALAGTPFSPVYLGEWGTSGFEAGQFASPYGLAVNASGWVYVADSFNDRVQVFDSAGVWQAQFMVNAPRGLDFDSAGTLYVVDSSGSVQKFGVNEQAKTFSFIAAFGTPGTANGQFRQPQDLAVDRVRSLVYVADTGNHRVQVFTTMGVFVKVLGSGYGSEPNQFKSPSGLIVDGSGNLYVADSYNNRVVKYNQDGNPSNSYGTLGSGDGQFNRPRGVAFDADGNLYVADTGNHRIQKLTSDGGFLAKWGAYGSANGQFFSPYTVGFEPGPGNEDKLYVLDSLNDRVQRFEPDTAPTVLALSGATVAEDEAAGTLVGTLSTTDANTHDTFTYTLVAGTGDTDNALFTISGSALRTAAVLDYETRPTLSVRVQVTDSGGRSLAQTFEISVTNKGEGPVLNDVTLMPVSEGAAVDYVAGTLVATDNDPDDTLTYSEVGGTGADAFNVLPNGQIVVADPSKLDYEGQPVVNLTVKVTDSENLSDTAVVTIYMADANDAPVVQAVELTIPENLPLDSFVTQIIATDEDNPVQTLTFTLLDAGNPGETFRLTKDGKLYVETSRYVDYERYKEFNLNITVTDNGLPSRTTPMVVHLILTNVNEKVVFSDQSVTIQEHSPLDTLSALMEAKDPEQDLLIWTVLSCEYPGLFTAVPRGINSNKESTGALKLLMPIPLDFETDYADLTFTALVEVSDGEFTDTAIITIRITNMNEPPTLLDGQEATVTENSPLDFQFGELYATDLDFDESFGYSIVEGDLKDVFNIYDTNNVAYFTVNKPKELNYEKQNTYTLTVRVGDSGDPRLYDTATVIVHVENANDTPAFLDATYSMVITSPLNTVVATLAATDEDNDPITYSFISGNDNNAFYVNAQGQLIVANPATFNPEVTPTIQLLMRATDDEGLYDDAWITIRIGLGNYPPVMDYQDLTIKENQPNGYLATKANATDQDGDALTYVITGYTGPDVFTIDSKTGYVTVKNSALLNYEQIDNGILTLAVEVTDDGVPSYATTAIFIFTVENVNEAPVLADRAVDLPEHSLTNALVYMPDPQDEDINSTFTYEILSGNEAEVFYMDEYGNIRVNDTTMLDFEANPAPYILTVQVTDSGSPEMTDTAFVTVNVTPVNEPPVITTGPFAYTINEGTPVDTVIDTFSATDPDVPAQNLTFSIIGGNTGSAFQIDPTTGVLSVAAPAALDFETVPEFRLTIRVTDSGEIPLTDGEEVVITLLDVDEAPLAATPLTFNVSPTSPLGYVVGTITAQDPEGGALSYEITDGNAGDAFAITADGRITVAEPIMLDSEMYPTFLLSVLVTDQTMNSTQVLVTINVAAGQSKVFIPITIRP